MGRALIRVGLLLAWACLAGPPSAADEARQRSGRPVVGTLQMVQGRLRFAPRDGGPPLAADDIERVRMDSPQPPPFAAGFGVRALLPEGQRLTGQLLDLDGDTLRLRTAWASRLEVPRAGLAAVTWLPGWRLRCADDFAGGLAAWQVSGKPSAVASPPAVVLDAGGQELSRVLPESLTAGRVGIDFEDRQKPVSARWSFEAVFADPSAAPAVLRVTAAGDAGGYRVDFPEVAGEERAVPRTPGVHRLVVQFTAGSLRVTCDDDVLWYTLKQGPPGPLRQVRLACRAVPGSGPVSGAVAWSDFTAEQAVDELPAAGGDSAQDSAASCDGDRVFGKVLRADRRGVELQGRFGRRTLGWDRLRGCFFHRAAPLPRTTSGAHARLELASGLDQDKDLLEGVIVSFDDKEVMLRHSLLGDLRLPRAAVRQVVPLFHGRRVELDNGFHHLGEPARPDGRIDPPRAEGTTWRAEVALGAVPDRARLVVYAAQLLTPDAEGSATEVVVNGRRLGYLNAQADRTSPRPRRLAFALPRDALRAGSNAIELKQAPDPKTGRRAHCEVFGMALETPE